MHKNIPILMIFILLLNCCAKQEEQYTGDIEKISIAEAGQPIGALLYVAYAKGFFNNEGLDVTLQKYTSGKSALNEGVLKSNTDLATTAETPFVHASLARKKLYIVATIGSSTENLAIVARKDKKILIPSDLKGKKIGVTKGTNGEFFLDTFLLFNKIKDSEVKIVNLKPEETVISLVNGDVDAFSAWNPHLLKAQEELGDNGIIFYDKSIYTWNWNIAGKVEYVKNNPETIKKVVRALAYAGEFVSESPAESTRIVAEHLKVHKSLIEKQWDIYKFELRLDQSLLLEMEDQAGWAIEKNLTPAKETPNYLDYIYFHALDDIKPDAVSLIRWK